MNSRINKSMGNLAQANISQLIRGSLLAVLMVMLSSAVYANTFRYIQNTSMDEQQAHYYDVILTDETTVGTQLFTFDFEALKSNQFTLNLPDGESFQVQRRETLVKFGSRDVWYGTIGNGEIHLAPHLGKQMLTGTIYLDDRTYSIRSLGKGIQVLIDYDASGLGECENTEGGFSPTENSTNTIFSPPTETDGFNNQTPSENLSVVNLEDDCYIRVIVAWTNPVDAAEADPLGLIMDAVSQTNAAYNNSGVNQQIKLVRAYNTDYDDTGLSQSTVLAAWRSTTDGNMDEVHNLRQFTFRADMCALITNVGTGVAYTTVSAANAFSCTRRTYVSNKTFQHELGHNHSCQHDPLNYGGASNYRGYGHPSGYFRTVMAYGSACGASPCTRVNEFSGPSNFYYYAPTTTFYLTGNATQNNVAGHNNNNGTIVDYYAIQATLSYSGSYDFQEFEYANFSGVDTAKYSSTNNEMIFNAGSEGSFNAGEVIRLGEGFWAKSGSVFTAELVPSCTSISANGNQTNALVGGSGNENTNVTIQLREDKHDHDLGIDDDIKAFPNPFSYTSNIQYQVKEAGQVTVQIFDFNGKIVTTLVNSSNHADGLHNVEFDASKLPAGMYHCKMTTKDNVKVIALSLSR